MFAIQAALAVCLFPLLEIPPDSPVKSDISRLLREFHPENFFKPEKESSARIEGEWTIESLEFKEYEIRGTQKRPMKAIIDKNSIVFHPRFEIAEAWGVTRYKGRCKWEKRVEIKLYEEDEAMGFCLTLSKNPAHIDLKEQDTGIRRKGIYRLNDDELELCIASQHDRRPNEFRATGSQLVLRLKRTASEK